jgi:hypothetical protein
MTCQNCDTQFDIWQIHMIFSESHATFDVTLFEIRIRMHHLFAWWCHDDVCCHVNFYSCISARVNCLEKSLFWYFSNFWGRGFLSIRSRGLFISNARNPLYKGSHKWQDNTSIQPCNPFFSGISRIQSCFWKFYIPNPTKIGRSKFVGVFGRGDRIHLE